MVRSELERRRKEKMPLELQWQLNSNFYDGNQYCDINPASREIEQYPVCGEGKSREVFNRIAPLIETRVANLKKINYKMNVRPATNEFFDLQKAKISTKVLQSAQDASGFNMKKDALILWNEICGSCFWLSWWDNARGGEYARRTEEFVDENGNISVRENVIYEGDVNYGLLTPYEVYPESIFRQSIEDQKSIIIEQVKTVDEIESLYGVRVAGSEVTAFNLSPQPGAGGFGYEATVISLGKAKMQNCQKVVTYFERRSRTFPDGRMAIIVGDELVYYGALPYDDIPLVRVVCKERPGQFFGKSVIEDLIPLQRAYNTACNDIADYLKAVKSAQYLVYEGSVDIDDFEYQAGVPGAILTYRGNPDTPPVRQSSVTFSGDVFTQKYNLEGQMEYVAAVSQLMVYGQTPSGVTSGTAIESLRDIDNTRLALTGDYIRNSVLEMAKIWLGMYKRYAKLYRVVKCAGVNDVGAALVWSGDDITDSDVIFSSENELMLSEGSQWQRVLSLLQAGITEERLLEEAAEKAREFIRSGAYNSEMSINELQSQAAERENTLLITGVIPEVNEYDNHKLHAEAHLKYMLQAEFKLLEKDKKALADAMKAHWKLHTEALKQTMGGKTNGI